MKRVKQKIYAGHMIEQIIYNLPEQGDIKKSKPRLRFKDEEERKKHREMISRKNHARAFHANFGPTSYYSTLTFDDEHEVHTFEEARRVRANYVRRLKRAFPDAVIFLYMGRGKSTSRIHFHMVSEGIPEEAIIEKWGQGTIRHIAPLRENVRYDGVDHGRDYTGLASYLYNHHTEEQGGHHYYKTANAKKYEKEEAKEVKRAYSEQNPPRTPRGYMLVETRATTYGYLYFRYIKIPPKEATRRRHRESS